MSALNPDGRKVIYHEPGDVWFFVYGSLMWDAPFPVAETRTALLHGYHRAFCVQSVIYRGTPERPGLSLGLDFGGSCRGLALRVAAAERDQVARYLEHRELQEDIYFCRRVSATTPSSSTAPIRSMRASRAWRKWRSVLPALRANADRTGNMSPERCGILTRWEFRTARFTRSCAGSTKFRAESVGMWV
jgi:hypothetical protein